jgi:outer membrane biosynthesis protein TonB
VRAIEAWRFSPAAKEGRPVSVWINWPVEFR